MKNKDIPLPLNDVIIHESAHAIIAFLYDYTIDKICIYPVSGSDNDFEGCVSYSCHNRYKDYKKEYVITLAGDTALLSYLTGIYNVNTANEIPEGVFEYAKDDTNEAIALIPKTYNREECEAFKTKYNQVCINIVTKHLDAIVALTRFLLSKKKKNSKLIRIRDKRLLKRKLREFVYENGVLELV